MLVVSHIRVRSLSTDYAHVAWQLELTAETVGDYDFFVLRSGSPSGPYEVIGGPLVDTYLFRDNTARDSRRWRDYYYRVRVRHRLSGDSVEFGSVPYTRVLAEGVDPGGVSKDPEPSLIAREVIYRHRVALRAYNGRRCWVHPIRNFGSRCPNCWDPIKGQRTVSKCRVCYGSSFVGGYHTPIEILARFGVDQVSAPNTPLGKIEPQQQQVFLANYPELKPGDVITELENDRWRVNFVNASVVQQALVSQVAQCSRIIRSDIEYEIPLSGVDPIRFDAVDERQYVGTMNQEGLEEYRNRRLNRDL